MALSFIHKPSPNFNHRRYKNMPDMIIIHYTGMLSCDDALQRLTDAGSNVSCHYLISRMGDIYQLVDEKYRAWHAGLSYWQGEKDINSRSIGIELENRGHEWGYDDFTDVQINALILLIQDIKTRYDIAPNHILGHSDVAPLRKKDPGEKFPWHILTQHGLIPDIKPQKIRKKGRLYPLKSSALVREMQNALEHIGYKTDKVRFFSQNNRAAITAFARRFVPVNPTTERLRIALQKAKRFYF